MMMMLMCCVITITIITVTTIVKIILYNSKLPPKCNPDAVRGEHSARNAEEAGLELHCHIIDSGQGVAVTVKVSAFSTLCRYC